MVKKISDRLAASMNLETKSESVTNSVKEGFARAKTAPGIMLEEQAKLREFEGAVPAKKIDPSLVDVSVFANRHEDSFESAAFALLMDEINAAGGNAQPVKVRPKQGGRFEIVFGHRRVEACRRLGIDVFAIIEDVDDKQLWLEMTYENEARSDLTPYEMSMHYKAAIEKGLYKNWSELAEALGKAKNTLSRYSVISDLPETIIDAFASPTHIKVRHADKLSELLKSDRAAVLSRAKSLKGSGASPEKVLSVLEGEGQRVPRVELFPLSYGSITRSKNKVSVAIDANQLTDDKLKKLYAFLQKL